MIAIFKCYHEYIWKNVLCKHLVWLISKGGIMSESTSRFSNCPKMCQKLVLKTYIKVQPWILFKKGQKKNLTFQLHFGLIWTKTNYRESPDSTVFAPPGNRTIEETVLVFGDWFSTKIAIYDFWIFKVPFFAHFQAILIFETKKVIIWFHFETFIELFITNSDIFITLFQTISNS